jgi:antitoxin (DNA-binding transcriptional repressor) of toxin-antitoxin stability system
MAAALGVQRLRLDMTQFLVYYLVMIKINIHEAKTHLSRYLKRLLQGEAILLCNRNRPVAELRALPPPRTTPRPVGLARGALVVPPAFFEPLPEELLDGFGGSAR